ncbi:MAG: glycosyltransferase family 2 protein [Pseudohongiellaceae bacterium]
MSTSIPVSVFIITRDEAENIGPCLDRLVEFDEVILVDSGSTDATLALAQQYPNVKTSFNEWPGFSRQKALAMSLCNNDWVLNVDADEILTDEYLMEVRRVVQENRVDALESNRTLYRWGRRPRHFGRDDRLIRLFRKEAGSYEDRRVHESISIDGEVEKTEATIVHNENLTFSQRVEKANKYSQAKAEDKFDKGHRANPLVLIFIFPVTFIQLYLFKGHFLDGMDGLVTSMNAAFYNFMKYAKLREMHKLRRRRRQQGHGRPPPRA